MTTLAFKPKQITKKLISVLPDRPQEVIVQRFGLGSEPNKRTLEAIGENYGITRERVRQIENFAMDCIRKNDAFSSIKEAAVELKNHLEKKGGLVNESDFLDYLSNDSKTQNHLYFLLVLADDFTRMKEGDEFSHRWTVDADMSENIQNALKTLHKEIGYEDLISEDKIIFQLKKHAEDVLKQQKLREEDAIRSWLALSKIIAKNELGEWGLASSPNINPRGMRDLAILVIKKHGSPMHFNEVAETISKLFSRKAHSATVHNELIKEDRFVLVGRGLYALKEWGYSGGIIRDVIKNILKASSGPLPKEEIVKLVLKERYVKDSTVLVNLQNRNYFKRNTEGNYTVV